MREHDVADAARLLAFALRPRQYAGQSVAYTQLLGRYRTEEEFAAAFHSLVEGLDLRVLDVTDRAVVVGAGIESPFAFDVIFKVPIPVSRLPQFGSIVCEMQRRQSLIRSDTR